MMTDLNTSRYLMGTTTFFGVAMMSLPAQAYVGPGLGLSAIGTFLAFLAAIFFAIIGFVWYPVKRARRRRQEAKAAEMAAAEEAPTTSEAASE